tara:strand:- start:270 stop:461 length:192 start_codon:yes stop_codon:yes gene_type:complete
MNKKEKILRITELTELYGALSEKYDRQFIDCEPELHDEICEEHRELYLQVYPSSMYWGILSST